MYPEDPVIVDVDFDASLHRVWTAITDCTQMRQWYFDNIPEFRPEVGFETHFVVQSHSRDFEHLWTVTAVIPERRLSYFWAYRDLPGLALVSFELAEKRSHTHLKLTHEGLDGFPQHYPEFSRESCRSGWDYFLRERLKPFLERQYSVTPGAESTALS